MIILNYLDNNGSNNDDNYSSISSIRIGVPIRKHISTDFIIVSYDNFAIFNWLAYSFYLIHALAYVYGSINKGNDIQLVTNIPLLTLMVSLGSPFEFQSLISMGFPMIF